MFEAHVRLDLLIYCICEMPLVVVKNMRNGVVIAAEAYHRLHAQVQAGSRGGSPGGTLKHIADHEAVLHSLVSVLVCVPAQKSDDKNFHML